MRTRTTRTLGKIVGAGYTLIQASHRSGARPAGLRSSLLRKSRSAESEPARALYSTFIPLFPSLDKTLEVAQCPRFSGTSLARVADTHEGGRIRAMLLLPSA